MNKIFKWVKVKDAGSLPNLRVLEQSDGRRIGFVYRPRNDKFNKNLWRCHIGIGYDTKFIGHGETQGIAKDIVVQTWIQIP